MFLYSVTTTTREVSLSECSNRENMCLFFISIQFYIKTKVQKKMGRRINWHVCACTQPRGGCSEAKEKRQRNIRSGMKKVRGKLKQVIKERENSESVPPKYLLKIPVLLFSLLFAPLTTNR